MKKTLLIVSLLVMATVASAQESQKRYELKSGIFKTQMSVMGQTMETTTYFDDYGALEASKAKTAMPGAGEIEVTTITKEGKTYVIIPSMKQVQQQPAQESINYLALTDEVINKYKIQDAGEETILGKECHKYTETITQQGQAANATVWVWKGLPLKSVISVSGMEIVSEVISLQEDAFVMNLLFEVPSYQ